MAIQLNNVTFLEFNESNVLTYSHNSSIYKTSADANEIVQQFYLAVYLLDILVESRENKYTCRYGNVSLTPTVSFSDLSF